MVLIGYEEHGIRVVGDLGIGNIFIHDDDFAFLISKMVERMDKKIKGVIQEYDE